MAQVPPYQIPEEAPLPRKGKSNTVLWVILIVVVGGGCLLLILLAAILYPVFEQARLAAQRSACMSNMRQLARGNLMYAAEFDETFPPKDDWFTVVAPYTSRIRRLRCPIAAKDAAPQAVGYGMNVAMAGRKAPERDKAYVLIFESQDTKRGEFGGKDEVVRPGRHGSGTHRGNNFSFTDGSAKFVPDSDDPGKWKP